MSVLLNLNFFVDCFLFCGKKKKKCIVDIVDNSKNGLHNITKIVAYNIFFRKIRDFSEIYCGYCG